MNSIVFRQDVEEPVDVLQVTAYSGMKKTFKTRLNQLGQNRNPEGLDFGETSSHNQNKAFLVTYKPVCQCQEERRTVASELTAHAPATDATIPPEIIIGRTPRVLLKIIPLNAPAAILFAESCFPLT